MPPTAPHSPTGNTGLFSAHDLMREILAMTSQRWIDPAAVSRLATSAGFKKTEARIYFLTQLRERIRQLPLKLFVAPEAREKILESMQTALDQEIAREEVA